MSTGRDVYVVTDDPAIARGIGEAIETCTHLSARFQCRDLDELSARLDQHAATAVIVDLEPEPASRLAGLEPIVGRHTATRFVVVASEQRTDWMLAAMQAGVRHFMPRASIGADLSDVLDRLVPPTSRNGIDRHGMVTVLSAGGGSGATTIAVNLANELQALDDGPALLVDLDDRFGGAAGLLGVTAQYGLADLLADAERLDAHLVRSTTVAYTDRLHLLASPATINFQRPAELHFGHLHRVLRSIREAYGHAVFDAPRVAPEVAAELARASSLTLIVFQMNVDDIRIARLQLAALFDQGVDRARVIPLANRWRKRRDVIQLADAKKALSVKRIETIGNDHKAVEAAINLGKTLAESAPRSPLRRDIVRLARIVAETTGHVATGMVKR